MNDSLEKNALIIIPKSQFCENELHGISFALKNRGVHIVVLSKSGQEARGMKGEKFQPDGMIVDWNKQEGVRGKYHAIILVGGKGAKKSLWDDPIIPQILTDHYRAGCVIGAMGSALVVLMAASLVTGEIPLPRDDDAQKKLESLNAVCIDIPVTSLETIVCGQGAGSVDEFSKVILGLMEVSETP
jgi:putative intracellular protease/amidase